MELPSTTSFTQLAIIKLSSPHVLHPEACNPTMDLVALLGLSGSGSAGSKGKGKAAAGSGVTKIALWRMGGSRVWDVDVEGQVGGLAWTIDDRSGLFLSVLVIRAVTAASQQSATINHLSVHTGEIVKAVPLPVDVGSSSDPASGPWILRWQASEVDWPGAEPGSAGFIIDSLPGVTPVEPPQAATVHPFMMASAAKAKRESTMASHAKLEGFPTLLPCAVPTAPDVLHVSSPDAGSSSRLMTGTLPLGRGVKADRPTLRLAQTCNRLEDLLNIILRGLEAIEHAFKEGEKQTMIWREELETCADQQGMSHVDVHSDLFRLLVTGRAGVAVTEWLGNRLTGRTVAKWETTLETSFKTIRQVMGESIGPALERIVLLLEELRGWSSVSEYSRLQLDKAGIRRALHVTLGYAKLVEKMRQQAEFEMYASAEWIKWLKYEIARAVSSQDISSDTFLPSLCDTKLVWHYLKHGFVRSPFLLHLPQQFRTRPPTDCLPGDFDPYPAPEDRPLADVMEETLRYLEGTASEPVGQEERSPVLLETSVDSSMVMSPANNTNNTPLLPSSPEMPSSPDTVDQKTGPDETAEPPRVLELEPWVWTNTLIEGLKELVRSRDVGETDSDALESIQKPGSINRTVDGTTYIVESVSDSHALTILQQGAPENFIALTTDGWSVLAMAFFDAIELALLVQSTDGNRYLATVNYTELPYQTLEHPDVPPPDSSQQLAASFARCRLLSTAASVIEGEQASIALNGRPGRRVGCICMGDGREIEVLDMDEDEDEGDGDEEDADMSGVVEE